jgi:hypothetical protein
MKDTQSPAMKRLEEDRRFLIEASICRIMKAR